MVVYNGNLFGKRVFFVGYPVRRARVYYYRKRVGVVFVVPLGILLPKEGYVSLAARQFVSFLRQEAEAVEK